MAEGFDFVEDPVSTNRWRRVVVAPDRYRNINSASTTTLLNGAGVLRRVIINEAVALGTVTIYDNIAASGAVVGAITFGAALLQSLIPIEYNCRVDTGLTIVTTGTIDLTVIYR